MARIFSSSVNMFYLLRVQEIVRIPITVKHRGVDIRDQVKAGRQQLKRGDVLPHDMVESSATAWRDEMSRKVAGK
ncbi:hypothetical protein AXH18_00290 [Escherichia coli]|nr:hypothetical protein WQ89_11650 [Escherichia coli]KXL35126.1 hypothetical protein AXH18_00290 [Escherichia coli]